MLKKYVSIPILVTLGLFIACESCVRSVAKDNTNYLVQVQTSSGQKSILVVSNSNKQITVGYSCSSITGIYEASSK